MQLTLNIPDNIFFGINETEKSLTQTAGLLSSQQIDPIAWQNQIRSESN